MPKQISYQPYTMVAAGGTVTFDTIYDIGMYNLIPDGGGFLLAGNLTIDPTGALVEGKQYTFNYGGGVTYDGGDITIFSRLLTAAEALKKYKITCTYINSAWDVKLEYGDTSGISGSSLIDGTTSGAKLIAGTVALSKLTVAAARGYAIRAGAGGVYETFDAKTSGNLLIGDGTDLKSVAVTGDITIASTGVATIGAAKVTKAMLAYTPIEYFQEELTITSAQILTLNGTPLTIVAAPGAGYHIEVISASSQMTFVAAAYATNTTLQLICAGADIAQLQDTAILISTVNKKTKFKDVTSAAAGQTQILSNTALQVKVATGNPITGDSAIKVTVLYKINAD